MSVRPRQRPEVGSEPPPYSNRQFLAKMFLLCSYLRYPVLQARIIALMQFSSQTRMFRLKAGGVSCDREGLFVGLVPLLVIEKNVVGGKAWAVRDEQALNDELSACYGLPIDCAAKRGGLAGVAMALNRGEVALAGIAALLLRFPNPPLLEKGPRSPDEELTLAADLFCSDLLKSGYWDPDKHPRTGEAPNRGWFKVVPQEPQPQRPGWPSKRANKALRVFARNLAKKAPLAEFGQIGEIAAFTLEILEELMPSELNIGEEESIERQQWDTMLDPPKTFEELQAQPIQNILGHERRHIVEQNPDNVRKRLVEKFTQERLDESDNIVWVPRFKHESISAYYSSKDKNDPQGRRHRDVINKDSFSKQYATGLERLRAMGVLK